MNAKERKQLEDEIENLQFWAYVHADSQDAEDRAHAQHCRELAADIQWRIQAAIEQRVDARHA